MAVRKLKGSWWVDFTYRFERVRRRSPLNTRAGAQEFEIYLRGFVSQHGSVAKAVAAESPQTGSPMPTFETFTVRWLRDYVDVINKPSEQRNKRMYLRAHLLPAFGQRLLDAITTADIAGYTRAMRDQGLAAKTVNNHLTVLRRCLATAVDWGELAAVPRMKFLKTTPPPFRFLDERETAALLAACRPGLWRTMVLVALKTGLRYSELAALEWADLDLAAGMLSVHRAVVRGHMGTPKNGRIRHVPLTGDVVEALRALGPGTGPVFQRDGQMISYGCALRYLWRRASPRAGLPPMGWHVMRHTFASRLVSRGAPLKAIQDLLGHGTINMTLRYAHLTPGVLREAMALLEPTAAELTATRGQPQPTLTSDTPVLAHAPQPDLA